MDGDRGWDRSAAGPLTTMRKAPTNMADKPFADMTADELAEQWRYWDRIIARAPGWGASLAAADDFRSACEMHLRRLGAWPVKSKGSEND